LAPHSPGTDQIATLLWIGLIAAALVVVAVNVGLLASLRRRRGGGDAARDGRAEGGRRAQTRFGAALAAFALVLFVVGVVFTEKARQTPDTGSAGLASAREEPLRINATGQQWLWRYDYPNGAFSFYKLVVPVDTAVELTLRSTDVVHTWNVPDLSGMREAVPGKTNRVVFKADEEGTYEGRAATLSGQGYASMGTAVEVVSPQEYENYVKQLKADIEDAQQRVVSLIEDGETP